MFEVDYTTVGSDKFVFLSGTPITPDNVALDTIGGTAQVLDGDFYVDTTTYPGSAMVKWDDASYNLYNQLGNGDNLRIIYDRSL